MHGQQNMKFLKSVFARFVVKSNTWTANADHI